jgi:methanogenic corrinoid protein MtbC1
MNDLLERLAQCIEKGKVNKEASYPPEMSGQDGASELTQKALAEGCSATDILEKALMPGMNRIGEKFGCGEAFIPELLIAAKAMNASMEHLKPYFESGDVSHKGTLVIGTVAGDLHDIGKNIVRMVMEGNGWKAVDLGVDVSTEKFLQAVEENPECIVGLSALLTTTMVKMEEIVQEIKKKNPKINVYVGGAPLTTEFCEKIGANGYFPDPQSFVKHISATF